MPFVGMVLGFMALMVFIMGLVAVSIIRIVKGDGSSRSSEPDAEETKLIQELHQGLMRMEQRIEALETILLEKERTEKEYAK